MTQKQLENIYNEFIKTLKENTEQIPEFLEWRDKQNITEKQAVYITNLFFNN